MYLTNTLAYLAVASMAKKKKFYNVQFSPQPSVLLQAQAQSLALQAASQQLQQLQQLQCKQQQQQQQQYQFNGTPKSSRTYRRDCDGDDDANDRLSMPTSLSTLQPIAIRDFAKLERGLTPATANPPAKTATSSSSSSSSPPPTLSSPLPFTRFRH